MDPWHQQNATETAFACLREIKEEQEVKIMILSGQNSPEIIGTVNGATGPHPQNTIFNDHQMEDSFRWSALLVRAK
jgi:hypothetical protein